MANDISGKTAKFCTKCGKPIKEGSKFCTGCGAPVVSPVSGPKVDVQTRPEKQPEIKPEIKPVERKQSDMVDNISRSAKETAENAVSRVTEAHISDLTEMIASSEAGETVLGTFGNASNAVSGVGEILNPIKTVISSVKSCFGNIVGVFKNKQWTKLIIAGIVAIVWLVLMILSYNGIHIGILEWLTFARGGMDGGVIGGIGGILGKATVATMLFSLIGGGYKSLGGGFKSLFKGENFKKQNLAMLLFGAGASLVIYQFFAGSAHKTDTMAAIAGALLAVEALGGKNGFIFKLVRSLTAKVSGKTRVAQGEKANALLSGVTYGFTLGAAVSLIPFGWLPVIFGGLCLVAGVVLIIVFKEKKEVAA